MLSTSIFHGLQVARTWAQRADDIVLGILALVAVVWYLSGQNRYTRSAFPLVTLTLALIVKVTGIYITYNAFFPGGPDFPIAVFLALTTMVAAWEYATTDRIETTTKPAPET